LLRSKLHYWLQIIVLEPLFRLIFERLGQCKLNPSIYMGTFKIRNGD